MIGFFSGSFDPFHLGHLAFAEAVISDKNLEKLYIIAEADPRHKTNLTPASQRQEIIKLTCSNNIKIATSFDGVNNKHSLQSILPKLKANHPDDYYILLMGADVFLNINNWEHYKEIIKNFKFAVALRTEDDGEELLYKRQELPDADVSVFTTDQATVTSSKIKDHLKNEQEVKGLSPEALQYIKDNNLYV